MAKKSKHQKRIEKLEREKLELEVAQLKDSKKRKNNWPLVTQAIIPLVALLVAFFSTYLSVYKDSSENKLEGMSARNEAILQENQTILELIDLERRKDTLGKEIQGFEDEKEQIFTQTYRLVKRSDSAQIVIHQQNKEKARLAGNIAGLRDTKTRLELELNFSEINRHLQFFKKNLKPDMEAFENILVETKKIPNLTPRVLDSLKHFSNRNFYPEDNEIPCYALIYLLSDYYDDYDQYNDYDIYDDYDGYSDYFGEEFRYKFFERFRYLLDHDRTIEEPLLSLILSNHWPKDDKGVILNLIRLRLDGSLEREKYADLIHMMNLDPDFVFYESHFEFYWEYLLYNRKIILDSISTKDDKKKSFSNIALCCPPMALSIMCTYDQMSSEEPYSLSSKYFGHGHGIMESFSRELAKHKDTRLDYTLWPVDFKYFTNEYMDYNVEYLDMFLEEEYVKHKEQMDYWVYGDLIKFRNDEAAFKEYMAKKQL